ncbi:MAG: tagatose-bisphosphate aldolase [Candidatus Komeilibacteria bacterium CG11_big_fil_rev_8_21_14_0_20_36_20]|uniref:Tagatose-bisphosphate aldolase n=1 Tax=Candidatus Komeilibacteria bacterium CG11_big_fil_rev_8_21_14_0_20_36_20 TaxID=1974477 RepID=A0A2H0NB16_9BACT|nr:MAG: tagatose-bisphosphate aldolase [Candidatus Komeilibacteria bacterium CG11_big_fil_rev_8_21_14_0_20_36_20]PIR82086.1 MAG: tagatose-bisphosphate aldolase [Candidatus Komeilibacteria bacterium CG10_big_fil_rev_8_21_14_0_10_36_65]PJC55693.1 MAG: tagatose-bisphosphate aldolase [Candidatus Komeilibacteria bacterium CG_4_9_14_0_2_um_filter_36_13]
MIVPIKKIVSKAKAGHYAVGAFNTSNLEITLAIVRAAVRQKSPVIIQTSESAIKYSNLQTLFNIITNLANTIGKSVPIAIHLDHGKHLPVVQDCIKIGYNSVHIDASEKDFSTNVRLSKQVAGWGHQKKIWVQAELGAILGKEGLVKLKKCQLNMKELMTNPIEAKKFIALTKVDTLAVSVGTLHGAFKGIEKVDQPLLKEINRLVKIPLVLHGGSGLSAGMFKQAIRNGISVINIDTNLRLAFKQALQKTINQKSDLIDPRKILGPATDNIQKEVEKMIKIFGSNNQA